MIGSRIGSKSSFLGSSVGSSADDEGTSGIVPTWSLDATSLKGVPASLSEWNQLIAAYGLGIGAPSDLYLLQEASGNAADSIGAIPLTAAGTIRSEEHTSETPVTL